jgi:Tfp pilus assembly protein PilF
MKWRMDIKKALHCFTMAISEDPTHVRAYLCRAEAYKRKKEVPFAS